MDKFDIDKINKDLGYNQNDYYDKHLRESSWVYINKQDKGKTTLYRLNLDINKIKKDL